MNMTQNKPRIGNPTSSGISALVSNGKGAGTKGEPFYTYVKKKNWERKLGRSIENEISGKPVTWGSLAEMAAFNALGIEYSLCSSDTLIHPSIDCWAGSPDGIKHDEGKTVIDIKCPFTLESFCELSECTTIEQVRKNHKDGDKYYWQLVSNAILTGSRFAELVVFCPYQSELDSIRALASNYDGADQQKFMWITFSSDSELPHLNNGGFYNHLHIIRFEVPQADKDLLTARVLEAAALLIPFHEAVTVENLAY